MNIVITGGGTGGHLAIARAVKEALTEAGIEPVFIGSTYGQDRRWFEEEAGWSARYFFDTRGVVNKRGIARFVSLWQIFRYTLESGKIFKKHDIDAVFSVGGYSAAPASFAAILFRKPLFIDEPNAVTGRLNEILKRWARAIISPYDPASSLKSIPIQSRYFQRARVRKEIKTILFLGGSQGAKAINDFAMQIAPILKKRGVRIIHQAGERDLERVRRFYHKEGIDADLFGFSDRLDEKIEEADFTICRAGASTLWELCASGLPALFVPYPHAAGDHQYYNAKFLADKNLSFVVREPELGTKWIEKIFAADIEKMSEGMRSLVHPGGAAEIARFIIESVKGTRA
ncbi:MAG: undecaprenyldiphospho-muramoylpentapeptide beta-N-acetylglucosaminyltransferase [Campylobacteraceae bacterium 4484_4]|nr:MAG: undecaprenyldiphospho-muramoylpentapeptide beta-N-acetylglucosaminyltransferase [Campylobacteraceae bacterium 4484_4]